MHDRYSGQDRLAAVFRAQAEGPGQAGGAMLAEAVAGGLQVDQTIVACSLTAITEGRYETLTSTSQPASAMDHLKYQAGSGPCVTAAAERRRSLAAGPGGPWRALPGWQEAADRFGIRGVLSVPLPGDRRAGLNLYAADAAALRAPVVIARAELIGRLIGRLMVGLAAPLRAPGPAPEQLSSSVAARRAVLGRARDALAWQEQVTAGEAFARLARRSAIEARSIFDIARDRRVRHRGGRMSDPERNLSLFEGLQRSGLTPAELWIGYYAVGGDAGELEVEAYCLGLLQPDAYEHNLIAQAMNETFLDEGKDHPVSYQDPPVSHQGPPARS